MELSDLQRDILSEIANVCTNNAITALGELLKKETRLSGTNIRFSKFLTQRLKSLAIHGIMVSIASGMTSERLLNEVRQLCDEVIDVSHI